jgi:peptide/nickel transport system substrate-binding protein
MGKSLKPAGIVLGVWAIASAVLVATALAQSASPQQTSSPEEKISFTLGSTSDIDSMNQLIMVSTGYTIHSMAYNELTSYAVADFSATPDLATEVPTVENGGISEDGLTWTYHIRDDAMWSDGVPLTADDVVYTFNRVVDDHWGCCFSYLKYATSITAPDATTIVIKLSRPALMDHIDIYIYPEHIWSKIPAAAAKTYENFPGVTSGAFTPVEWKKGQFMRLEANKDYFRGAPHVDEIVWRVFNNQDAAVEALKNHEIDFIDVLKPNLFNSLKDYPGVGTAVTVTDLLDDFAFNTGSLQGDGNPALRDPDFRRALSMAIDKQTLIDKVMLGYAAPGDTLVSTLTPFWHETVPPDDVIPFDIAGANALLDESGYVDSDDNGIRNQPNGGPDINLRYFLTSSVDSTVPTSQFVQNWFKQIGIATTIKAYGDGKMADIEVAGTYDIVHWDWYSGIDPDFILSVATCEQRPELDADGTNVGGIWSDTQYCDKEYDKLYLEQKTALDADTRAEIVKKMQLQLYDSAAYVVLWYNANLQAYNSDWTGFTPQPAQNGDLLAQRSDEGWRSVRPVAATTAGQTQTKGISAGVWVGIVAAIVAIVGVVAIMRRRRGDEDRV